MRDDNFTEIVQTVRTQYKYPIQVPWPVSRNPLYYDVPTLVNESIVQFAGRK